MPENPENNGSGHNRKLTLSIEQMEREQDQTRAELATLGPELKWLDENFPKTRADCEDGERPCPFLRCSNNLALSVDETRGSISLNLGVLEDGSSTCALDFADRQIGLLGKDIANYMGLTHNEVYWAENRAIAKIRRNRHSKALRALSDYASHLSEK